MSRSSADHHVNSCRSLLVVTLVDLATAHRRESKLTARTMVLMVAIGAAAYTCK